MVWHLNQIGPINDIKRNVTEVNTIPFPWLCAND